MATGSPRPSTTRWTATSIPDEVYYYGIYAIYPMPDGRLFPSPGIVVSARPQPPITALGSPSALAGAERGASGSTGSSRRAARSGSSARPIPCSQPAGTRLTTAEAERSRAAGSSRPPPIGPTTSSRPARATVIYTPMAGMGRSLDRRAGVVLSRVSDPTELRATPRRQRPGLDPGGVRVTLRWRWPAEANAALVVARQGTPPQGPNDPLALAATVSRADYDRQDCWTLTLPATKLARRRQRPGSTNGDARSPSQQPAPVDAGPWHIRVYSVIDGDGVRSISPGLEPTAATILPGPNPDVTVSYAAEAPLAAGLAVVGCLSHRAARQLTSPRWWSWRTTVGCHCPLRTARSSPVSPPDAMGTSFQFAPSSTSPGKAFVSSRTPRSEPQMLVPIVLRHPEAAAPRSLIR